MPGPLEPFVELTVRVSVAELFGDIQMTHDRAVHLLGRYGLGMLVDYIGKPETSMVMRVRTTDKDHVYPLITRKDQILAVVDAPGFGNDTGE